MLKVFSGEVLTAFERQALFRQLTTVRTIPFGKSAQFPVQGYAYAYTHTPGDEILGSKINSNERVINIEGLNIAPVFIPNIDEFLNAYDYRSSYGNDIALALSKLDDQNTAWAVANAARVTTGNVTELTGGTVQVNPLYATDGPTLFAGAYDLGVSLDSKDVPVIDRSIVVRPTGYALLIKSEKPIDYRTNDGATGLGGYASGKIAQIYGVDVYKTNNYQAQNNVAGAFDSTSPTARQHDYSTSQLLMFHKQAAGTVNVQDMTMESEYDMRRQGWLMVGKYLSGKDVLRPEAAGELQSATPAG
jgi:hypothetical protein